MLKESTVQAIINVGKLSRVKYQCTKKIIKNTGHNIFPSWKKIKNFQDEITPKPKDIFTANSEGNENFCGVYYSYPDAIEKTIRQIIKVKEIDTLTERNLKLDLKYGFDGSGSHKMFHQEL